MKKFEYLAITLESYSDKNLINSLNNYGEDGWELSTTDLISKDISSITCKYIFKREI